MLRDMFKKTYIRLDNVRTAIKQEVTPEVPHGMWRQCKKCSSAIYVEDVKKNFYICPKCSSYFRIHANRRIEMITDEGSFVEWNTNMEISNPLDFPDYENKLEQARQKTKLDEAVVTGRAEIDGEPTVICACDARFMMGSMGHNVGEKITYAVERAAQEKLPVIIFACSGGARMQEGIISLMQMAKTSAALRKLHDAGQVYISFLTDPTTGGVTASFAMLGDIILAEPKALIGFAGPRVIAQTIGAKLPEGFQRSEFLLEHGFIDAIVERKDQRDILAKILKLHSTKTDIALKLLENVQGDQAKYSTDDNAKNKYSNNIDNKVKDLETLDFSEVDDTKMAWDSVINSRKSDRPTSKDYIEALFSDFIELHGDRAFGDDGAIIGGIAMFHGIPVTVIGQQKGRSIKENKSRNFGMPSPEGYRKALRLMKEADDFGRPIICFVDTPGAFCGLEAEERGQGEAIARNLYEMSAMAVPILTIVIGEGGSGGALAMAVANEVYMMQHAIYSILSPEGFASILYKDAKKCKEAAEDMKITAPELLKLGIIEKIIPERIPASKDTIQELTLVINEEIILFIDKYSRLSKEEIVNERYNRFRKF